MDRTVCGDCGAPMELCDCKSFFRAKEIERLRTRYNACRKLLDEREAEFGRLKAERDEYLWALESIQHAGRGDYHDRGQTLAEWASNALIRGARACPR